MEHARSPLKRWSLSYLLTIYPFIRGSLESEVIFDLTHNKKQVEKNGYFSPPVFGFTAGGYRLLSVDCKLNSQPSFER